jgi:hypothetical protein
MAITRMQIPEQIRGYQDGGLASIDAFSQGPLRPEFLQQKQDSPTNETSIDPLLQEILALSSQQKDNEDEARNSDMNELTFQERFDRAQNQLKQFEQKSAPLNIYDAASTLGAALLSAPPTAGVAKGLGIGFLNITKQMQDRQNKIDASRKNLALQAFKMAKEDERAALKFLNEKELEIIKQKNKEVKYVKWEIPEIVNGQPTGKKITKEVPASDFVTQEQYRKMGGLRVSDKGDTFNIGGKTSPFLTETGKSLANTVTEWTKQSTDAMTQKNLFLAAKNLAKDLPKENFGVVAASTLPLRKFLQDLGVLQDKNIADQELVKSFGTRIAMGLIGQTKGAISNAEMNLFLASSPGLANTKDGYIKLIDYLNRINQKSIDFLKAYNQAIIDGEFDVVFQDGNEAKIQATVGQWQNDWHERNPLFTKEERIVAENLSRQEDASSVMFRKKFENATKNLFEQTVEVEATELTEEDRQIMESL